MDAVLLSAIADTVTALVAIGTLAFAIWGFNTWRTEAVTKRKAELAEEVLVAFYRVKAILLNARLHVIFPHEMFADDGKTRVHEAEVVHRRLAAETPFWAQFWALRDRFEVIFGEGSAAAFDSMDQVLREVSAAALTLMHSSGSEGQEYEGFRAQVFRPFTKRGEEPQDEISKRVQKAIDDVGLVCRPAIARTSKVSSLTSC